MGIDATAAGAAALRVHEGETNALDQKACDGEPIHLSGAIQPHGLLLIADATALRVVAGAGNLETRLRAEWLGLPLAELVAQPIDAPLAQARALTGTPTWLGIVPGLRETFDATLHLSGNQVLVELEARPDIPASLIAVMLRLDALDTAFERAPDLNALCECATLAFRELTGFDRVMVYRFSDDGAGIVLAEDRDPALPTFLNHHFPASDISPQARALYIRNRMRVIPDVHYTPAPIRPVEAGPGGIDLTDVALRSVSPVHIQYLINMEVGASASVAILKDGLLWGLIVCHNRTPRRISHEARIACQALAGCFARQVRAKEEAAADRERITLRSAEEALIARLDLQKPFADWCAEQGESFYRLLDADGFAAVLGQEIVTAGLCPSMQQIGALAQEVGGSPSAEPFATSELGSLYVPAQAYRATASGVLAMTLPGEARTTLLWFRAEQPETVEWAGNPHEPVNASDGQLAPRTSFDAWREEVSGRSRRWTAGEVDAARRLRRTLTELRQGQRMRDLDRQLGVSVAEKAALIAEKDHLLREVNHRVQNSLQLVRAFLSLQAHSTNNKAVAADLGEAQRRLSAVALVHRRLYQGDQFETVDLGRYVEELIDDTMASFGPEWQDMVQLDLAPVLISADRAIHTGLILTELVINANKYAYDGKPGPLAISIEQHRDEFRLIVADRGSGKARSRVGFGTRMMDAMVQRLRGTIEYLDNAPGLRVVLTAPVGH